MKVSRKWLQTFFDKELPTTAELSDAIMFHAFEVEGVEQVEGDDVLDVKVLQRGRDCLSHRGVGGEISAILNIPFTHDPLKEKPDLSASTDNVVVSVEDSQHCRRYIAGLVTGVKVGPSPEWLKIFLESVGQRSINNVVDATNFVMLNIGQPLHAFAAEQLGQKDGKYAIEVRKAKAGESMLALDDKTYQLSEQDLVIADANSGAAIGIAGVKGGKPAGISETTKDIVLESANFSGVSVRKTAQRLKLRTDASHRFEQTITPELAGYGMRAVADLIVKIAGGTIAGFVDVYPEQQSITTIEVSLEKTNAVLGTKLSSADVADVFRRLRLNCIQEGERFTITVPFERLDLTIPEDLIEEVGRIIGYETIPAVELPPAQKKPEINQNFAAAESVRKQLTELGYSEVFTSVFAEKGEREVLNKVGGEKPFLRTTLVDGLNEALAKNKPNKDLLGLKEIKLFEIGMVWKGGNEEMMAGIVTEKEAAKEDPLSMYIKETNEYEKLPYSTAERYQPFSRYPSITRDIAMWVPSDTASDTVKEVIASAAGDLMMRIDQFDEFKKGDKTSYAFRLVFQSLEKTLTDDEANSFMSAVYEAVKAQGWEVR